MSRYRSKVVYVDLDGVQADRIAPSAQILLDDALDEIGDKRIVSVTQSQGMTSYLDYQDHRDYRVQENGLTYTIVYEIV